MITLLYLFILCIGCEPPKTEDTKTYQQLNISIFLDLSDRINPKINPFQIDRDIACIKSIINSFRRRLKEKGTVNTSDKIQVFFYPHPQNEDLAESVDELNIDLGQLDLRQLKQKYFTIDSIYTENIKKLYNMVATQLEYNGSDIWRFFKDEIRDKCIIPDSAYRNILVIFTDGYLYWKNTMVKNKNRYSYIERKFTHLTKFRDYGSLKANFDSQNYGFIKVQDDLSNIDIIVLEVNPSQDYPQDFDIIKKYWEKWFTEMKVNKYKILKTDFPANTSPIIETFMSSK